MNTPTKPHPLNVLVSSDLGRVVLPTNTVEEASTAYRAYITSEGLGASQISQAKVIDGSRKLVATIRYNGVIDLEAR